jgi:hypothetical protein
MPKEKGVPKEKGGPGYKDLYAFNLAMLSKQAWRLLTKPDSLCARVMKAKYFLDCTIFEVRCKDGVSYAWRVELLREGVIKRVGDGSSIDILNDPWLPSTDYCTS